MFDSVRSSDDNFELWYQFPRYDWTSSKASSLGYTYHKVARLFVVRSLIACVIRWRYSSGWSKSQSSEAAYSGTCWKYLFL